MSETSTSGLDVFETNNSINAAADLGLVQGLQQWSNLNLNSGDEDWFRFELITAGNYSNYLEISFEHDLGDIDLELYDAEGNKIDFSDSINDFERINLSGFAPGIYYVRIYGYQGSANPEYNLILNAPGADAYEANDTMDTASNLGEISGLKVYENLSIGKAIAIGLLLP